MPIAKMVRQPASTYSRPISRRLTADDISAIKKAVTKLPARWFKPVIEDGDPGSVDPYVYVLLNRTDGPIFGNFMIERKNGRYVVNTAGDQFIPVATTNSAYAAVLEVWKLVQETLASQGSQQVH